ncbi:MAG: Na+/H+ antiporter NhaA [Gammaproteobacteria bacterium]
MRLTALLHHEASSGVMLVLAAAVALTIANSPWSSAWHAFWHGSLSLLPVPFDINLRFLVNDGLMTLFFFTVGLEVRHEMHSGTLATRRRAAVPLIAAAGGVVVPALIYLGISRDPATLPGWAVPTATDIAFAVGLLALLGSRVSSGLRVLLLSIAIIDDIAAILIIALVYTGNITEIGIALSAIGIGLVFVLQRLKIWQPLAYVPVGAVIWLGLLWAGIHPVVSGVILGLLTPAIPNPYRRPEDEQRPPVVWLQKLLHPWSTFLIMPVFALANAGVHINGNPLAEPLTRNILFGVVAGLVIGKPLGIVSFCWITHRIGLIHLPADVSWRGLLAIGGLAGIGFTMSIFIGGLAFAEGKLLDAMTLGVLAASVIAAAFGLAAGRTLPAGGGRR